MRAIKFLMQKEFKQIFRNKAILVLIMAMPVVQLIILPLAADFEVKNINLAVVDHNHSPYSQKLISTIASTPYFKLKGYNSSYDEAFKLIESDKADLVLEIPQNFERNLVRENRQKLFVAVNAINGSKANLGGAYLSTIIRNFNQDIRLKLGSGAVSSLPVQIGSTLISAIMYLWCLVFWPYWLQWLADTFRH